MMASNSRKYKKHRNVYWYKLLHIYKYEVITDTCESQTEMFMY